MGDRMAPVPFGSMMDWILREYGEQGSIFGVKKMIKHPKGGSKLPLFGEKLEAPFGPAAGPHTQLAQNIVAAYVAGSRFFELKTVQILDGEDLPVAKPCIRAEDECYNCEWSTELRVPQAFDEYVKAWFACKLLSREMDFGDEDGFILNMSVGYDLEGIRSPKIDAYIEGMKNAASTSVWQDCKNWTLSHLNLFKKVDASFVNGLSLKISRSITLSTLHGCPPQEIERIASYLLTEKHLHTYVKCNPTLLGYDYARNMLDSLGFDYIAFDDHHFREDLQFEDAVPMFKRLMRQAEEEKLEFGVKLTNTFPVDVTAGELPSEEMYMSGRALFPLTLSVAQRISQEFNGLLRISYSGGVDNHNISDLFEAGIWPITMATTMLKPGGYQRLTQIAGKFDASRFAGFAGVNTARVLEILGNARQDPYYRKPIKPIPGRKLAQKVPLIDCFTAPCRGGCPIQQDVPAYLRLAGEGNYGEAFEVILQRNPLPFITGTICSHRCMDKCTRNFYEDPIHIRNVKLETARSAYPEWMRSVSAPKKSETGKYVAVVGGGPAGLSAAYFLAREGIRTAVFEKREKLGGIVRYVIPEFRIGEDDIEKDIALVQAMGVEMHTGAEVRSVEELMSRGFTDVILATGAWQPGTLKLASGQAMGVLSFLEQCKEDPEGLDLGANVVVIGGGNTAMDAARAAKRVPGVKHVRLVYRRTRRYMPADEEELDLAIQDGVEFCELLAPDGLENGVLKCRKMKLGSPDSSGRRSPVETGEMEDVPADTVISAVGEKIDGAFFTRNHIELTERGRVKADLKTLSTSLPNVYVAGDANRGPATVVEAIADAMRVAHAIAGDLPADRFADKNVNPHEVQALDKKGCLSEGKSSESERCLECATVCECCADVCPNRANVAVAVAGRRMRQIIHLDGLCNECGNCATFCPYDSAPYRDKFTLFWSEADFENSGNDGFLPADFEHAVFRVRLNGNIEEICLGSDTFALPQEIIDLIDTVYRRHAYLLTAMAEK